MEIKYIEGVYQSGVYPFRWWIIDGHPPALINNLIIPDINSDIWEAKYIAECEQGKRTTRKLSELDPRINELYSTLDNKRCINWFSRQLNYEVENDPTMHGGGLHVTSPGGQLSVHLDYDRHPKLPTKRRAVNLIAFIHPEWESTWGGELVLCDPLGNVIKKIEPLPGRLVAFEVSDLSYHGVMPITGPKERVSLAVYFLNDAGPTNTRQRALFMPTRVLTNVGK